VHERSGIWAKYLWAAAIPLFILISVESAIVRPDVARQSVHNPLCWVGVIAIIVSSIALISGLLGKREMRAFLASNFLIVSLLATGGAAIFPVMLYSTLAPENSLTAYNVSSGYNSLILASIWWPLSFVMTILYFVFISRRYAGKVSVKRDNQVFH
jgi:cytochrome d ubiquinol oxidase subunit II